jgi:nucleotide-binding universal stress UspA family protein
MYTKILVPVDGSPTSLQGLAEAVKLAKLTGAKLKLLHVIDLLSIMAVPEAGGALTSQMVDQLTEGGRQILADAKARAEAAGITAETQLVENAATRVCDVVIDQAGAWGAELIVIGTHGRRGVGRMLRAAMPSRWRASRRCCWWGGRWWADALAAKQLLFGDDARDRIRRGVDALADAVKVITRGRTVIIDRVRARPS